MGLGCRRGSQGYRGATRGLLSLLNWEGTSGLFEVRANKQNWRAFGFLREEPSSLVAAAAGHRTRLSVWGPLFTLGLLLRKGAGRGLPHFSSAFRGTRAHAPVQTGFPEGTSSRPRAPRGSGGALTLRLPQTAGALWGGPVGRPAAALATALVLDSA